MELSVHENQGVTVVMVSGRMDAGNSTQLGEELDHLLTEGSRKLVIDLGKVGFMNSSGLATLVRYYKLARSNLEIFPWQPCSPQSVRSSS
jgi:anti-sigma B factor antagonist